MTAYVVGYFYDPRADDKKFGTLAAALLEAGRMSEPGDLMIAVWTDGDVGELVALSYGGKVYQ